jgi:hypothetical protein
MSVLEDKNEYARRLEMLTFKLHACSLLWRRFKSWTTIRNGSKAAFKERRMDAAWLAVCLSSTAIEVSPVWCRKVSRILSSLSMVTETDPALKPSYNIKAVKKMDNVQHSFVVRFEVVKTHTMNVVFFWDVAPCSPVAIYQCFRLTYLIIYSVAKDKSMPVPKWLNTTPWRCMR